MYGVRGLLYVELVATGAQHDLHSGYYGGVAPNPLVSLCHIVAGLKSPDGTINIPGLDELAVPVTNEERGWWAQYSSDEEERLKAEMGVTILAGEGNYSPTERQSARASMDVHGFIGGYQDEGAKTVIPAEARVKLSLRLVPNQTPDNVLPLLVSRIHELTPPEIRVDVVKLSGGAGMLVDVRNKFIEAARMSLTQEYGHETYFIREGATIPVAALFQDELKVPIVFAGYGLADECLHAPNEHLDLDNFFHGIHCTTRFLTICKDLLGG